MPQAVGRDAGRLMRLPPQPGERIDRSRRVAFTFDGKPVDGLRGRHDRLGALRVGARVFSRSFKYHRPRGLLCCSGQLPELHDEGRRRAERARLRRAGARGRGRCEPQNVLRLARPRPARGRRQARRPVHPGRLLLPHDDPAAAPVAACTRSSCATSPASAGVDKHAGRTRRYDTEHRRVDVLVIGGGRSGREAAARRRGRRAAGAARRRARRRGRRTALRGARARRARSAIYEGGLVPVDAGDVLLPLPRGADRRRDRGARAAARLPRQRPRRRDAARRRAAARRRVGAQAGRARP